MFSNLSKGSMFVSLKSFLLHDIMLGLQNHCILRKPQLTEDGYHPEHQIIYFLSSRKTESIRSTWPIGFSFKKLNRKMEFVYIGMTKSQLLTCHLTNIIALHTICWLLQLLQQLIDVLYFPNTFQLSHSRFLASPPIPSIQKADKSDHLSQPQ